MKKVKETARVYIPVEEEFLDAVGATWKVPAGGNTTKVLDDLREVLAHTIFQCPVKTGEDAVRTLECLEAINASDNGSVEMRKDDFDWMMAHFKEMAFRVWLPPDAAFLVRHLETVKSMKAPEPED